MGNYTRNHPFYPFYIWSSEPENMEMKAACTILILTLHSEMSKLYTILAFLSAIGLNQSRASDMVDTEHNSEIRKCFLISHGKHIL